MEWLFATEPDAPGGSQGGTPEGMPGGNSSMPQLWVGDPKDLPQDDLKQPILISGICLSLASLIVVGLRVGTRAIILRSIGVDDYCMVMATLLAVTYTIWAIYGTLVKESLGIHIWNMPPETLVDTAQYFMKNAYFSLMVYVLSVGLARTSVILLLLRFQATKRMTIVYKIFFVLNAIGTLLILFLNVFRCTKPSLLWTTPADKLPELMRDPRCRLNNTTQLTFIGPALNIVFNVLIFTLPLQILTRLDIPIRQRLGLSVSFLLGLLTLIGSGMVLKTARVAFKGEDPFYNSGMMVMWLTIEMHTFIICASLPVLKALVTRLRDAIQSTVTRSKKVTTLGSNDCDEMFEMKSEAKRNFKQNDVESGTNGNGNNTAGDGKPRLSRAPVIVSRVDRSVYDDYESASECSLELNADGFCFAGTPALPPRQSMSESDTVARTDSRESERSSNAGTASNSPSAQDLSWFPTRLKPRPQ